MHENADQNNSEYGHFFRSEKAAPVLYALMKRFLAAATFEGL